MNHTKQQSSEHTQMVAAQEQMTHTAEVKGRVPEAEASDKLFLKREKNDRHSSEEEKKQQQKKKDREKEQALTGKLLDTVA